MKKDKYIDLSTVSIIATVTLYNPVYDTYISVFQVSSTPNQPSIALRESFIAVLQCLSFDNHAVPAYRLSILEPLTDLN